MRIKCCTWQISGWNIISFIKEKTSRKETLNIIFPLIFHGNNFFRPIGCCSSCGFMGHTYLKFEFLKIHLSIFDHFLKVLDIEKCSKYTNKNTFFIFTGMSHLQIKDTYNFRRPLILEVAYWWFTFTSQKFIFGIFKIRFLSSIFVLKISIWQQMIHA